MVFRPIWVVHIKRCRQAWVWLLRNLSAKKINKPFDHKGPIHSLTLRLTLSFCLSFTPPPPRRPNLLLGRFCSAILMAVCAFFRPSPSIWSRNVCFWKKKDNKSWLDEPGGHSGTDGQAVQCCTRTSLFHGDGNMTWKISSSLHRTWSRTSAQSPPPPQLKSSVTHMLAASFPTSEHLCECFLMHASVAGVKRPSSPIALLLWLCAALWVWLHYHLPPQAYFPFSKHSRLPPWKTDMNWAPSETNRQQAWKTWHCH